MATFTFNILSAVTVEVIKDGESSYKPRNMVPTVDGNTIYFTHPTNIIYNFYIASTDSITAAGSPVTGTADEIANALSTDIFNIATEGGGGGVSLDAANTWTENQIIQKDQASPTGLTTKNDHASGNASVYSYAGVDESNYAGISASVANGAGLILVADNGDAYLSIDSIDAGSGSPLAGKVYLYCGNVNPMVLEADSGFDFTSQVIFSFIGNYADDSAAATGGVPVGGIYRTGSALKIRVA